MSAWTIPDRDLSRRIAWHLTHAYLHFITPENGYARDGKWHAVHGEQRYIADTLGELMDQLETLA